MGDSCALLCAAFLQPDVLQRDGAFAQVIDLHALHIGLVQVIQDIMVLEYPWRIVHDQVLHLTVERHALRIVELLPGLFQHLVDQGLR